MPWCQHRNSATGKPDVVHFQDGTGELIPGLRHGWKGSIPAPRTQIPYDKEVQEMVEALSGERLFQRAPGHYHPGFENFINKAHLRNPSRLHGTLVVHSCKLCCGRERHLLEDLEEGDDSDTEGKEENQEDDGTGRRRQRLRPCNKSFGSSLPLNMCSWKPLLTDLPASVLSVVSMASDLCLLGVVCFVLFRPIAFLETSVERPPACFSPVLLCIWLLICAFLVFCVLCPVPACCVPGNLC